MPSLTTPKTTFNIVILDIHYLYTLFHTEYIPKSEYYVNSSISEISDIFDALILGSFHNAYTTKYLKESDNGDIPGYVIGIDHNRTKDASIAHKDMSAIFELHLFTLLQNLSFTTDSSSVLKCMPMGSTLVVGIQNSF